MSQEAMRLPVCDLLYSSVFLTLLTLSSVSVMICIIMLYKENQLVFSVALLGCAPTGSLLSNALSLKWSWEKKDTECMRPAVLRTVHFCQLCTPWRCLRLFRKNAHRENVKFEVCELVLLQLVTTSCTYPIIILLGYQLFASAAHVDYELARQKHIIFGIIFCLLEFSWAMACYTENKKN